MECKNCGAVLNEEDRVCAVCGQEFSAEEQEIIAEAVTEEAAVSEQEETVEETAEDLSAEENDEETGEEAEAPAKKNTGLIVALIACVAAIAILIVLLITGKTDKNTDAPSQDNVQADSQAGSIAPVEDVLAYVPAVSYMVDDASVFDEAFCAQVVATCGDNVLTTEKLAFYYWREVYSFMSSYSSYISMMMDPYGRLDQQQSLMGEMSWDEMFMESALESYHTYASASEKGKREGFTLSAEERESLDTLPEQMQSHAVAYGFATADEYIQSSFGPYTSLESYVEFMEEYVYAASYLDYCLDNAEYTKDDLVALYEANRADYEAAGIEMDDRPMIDIRHILFMPEKIELAEGDEGYEAAKQAALDAAREEAEAVYAQWQEGDMSEDSFAELATEHSDDGSAVNGGLIQEIAPGQTVENFDAWCFTEGRAVGDHGMVETEFGYHIIYISAIGEESYWHRTMVAEYQNTLFMEICDNIRKEFVLETDMSKAAVYPTNVALG